MNTARLMALIIIIISFILGLFFYSFMPDKIAGHWSTANKVDSYISKFWGLFLMPFVALGLFLLFIFLPKIDPLRKNVKKFMKYYDLFILILILFLFYLYILTITWNLGFRFVMIQLLAPAFAVLFFYIGILLENAKRNWFIGIRTPWTLTSNRVWKKTHKLGAKLFKISGIIALFGIILPGYAVWFVIAPVVISALYTVLYSYFKYKR